MERHILRKASSAGGLLALGYVLLAIVAWGAMRSHSRPPPPIAGQLGRVLPDRTPGGGRPGLFFIFNPVDCPDCLRLGRYWNAAIETGSADVVGVAVAGVQDSASGARLARRLGYRYPVVPERDRDVSRALLALGQDTTPVTVLTDAGSRPVLIVPPLRDPTAQIRQAEIVRRQIERLRRYP